MMIGKKRRSRSRKGRRVDDRVKLEGRVVHLLKIMKEIEYDPKQIRKLV